MKSLIRRAFAVTNKQTPQQFGSFEQSFHIPPRYFMLKYRLHDTFDDFKSKL